MDETDVDSYFYHNILEISQSHNRIVRVSKKSNKKSFAFKVFHFCDSKLQQGFILKEEVRRSQHFQKRNWVSTGQFGWISESFRSSQQSIADAITQTYVWDWIYKSKDELFSHCYKDIVEHLNRQIRLSFRFEKNNTWVFSIKMFEQYGDQFILTEVVNLDYREIKHLYKNRYFVAYKCDIFQSNYNV